jgi:hypothetical protein
MIVKLVHQNLIAQTWPQVKGFISSALKYGDDYTIDQVKLLLMHGTWVLLISVDEQNFIRGAMTISFMNYPNDRIAFITTTGGKGICTKEALKEMKHIVLSLGATKVQAGARPAMVRMLKGLGFNERYMVVEANI